MKILWTQTALGQLQTIHNEIERSSAMEAKRLLHRLTRRAARIAQAPHDGPISPEFQAEDVREVFEGAFRLIYLVRPERIDILAVLQNVAVSEA